MTVDASPDAPAAERTRAVTRGVCRMLDEHGHAVLTEFALANGRRADIIALDDAGTFTIVEVKVSAADFGADAKWPQYADFCDRLYFAVPPEFPREILPDRCGVLVADAYGAEELRAAPHGRLHASRRKALTLRFARAGAVRLQALLDPRLDAGAP